MVNLDFEDLIDKHWLTVRCFNVLKSNSLTNLPDILDYYIQYSTFLHLPNCGAKSNTELIEMCKVYINEYKTPTADEVSAPSELMDTYNSFDLYKRSVFDRIFYNLLNNLSVRGINGLSCLSGNYSSVQKFLHLFFVKKNNFKEIINIGEKTADELVMFKAQVKSSLLAIVPLSLGELNKAFFKMVIRNSFDQFTDNQNLDFDIFFTENDQLHLFKLLNGLIVNQKVYNQTTTNIFLSFYTLDNSLNMKKVADTLQLSRERVRQINKEIEDNFKQTFGFIKNLSLSGCVDYSFSNELEVIIDSSELTKHLNNIDGVNFNSLFYANTLCILFDDCFSLFDPTNADITRASINE